MMETQCRHTADKKVEMIATGGENPPAQKV